MLVSLIYYNDSITYLIIMDHILEWKTLLFKVTRINKKNNFLNVHISAVHLSKCTYILSTTDCKCHETALIK